ncbi:hypothetical protein BDV25DRAFT_58239 [Aspergillus avenaceus]|uniref:Uncharacterized protein n=1 Tax=Aspergillus avenaceus TaxID=36643 RepID=A0A5N6TI68_ASPAV|nr:hypothetical protein BDV25DRAFT_58239 [Aspergillus avenaceus]
MTLTIGTASYGLWRSQVQLFLFQLFYTLLFFFCGQVLSWLVLTAYIPGVRSDPKTLGDDEKI